MEDRSLSCAGALKAKPGRVLKAEPELDEAPKAELDETLGAMVSALLVKFSMSNAVLDIPQKVQDCYFKHSLQASGIYIASPCLVRSTWVSPASAPSLNVPTKNMHSTDILWHICRLNVPGTEFKMVHAGNQLVLPIQMSLQDGTSAELRAAKHEKHMAETIPNHLRWHEALLEKSSGTYYAEDTITLPDLDLVSLFLRYRDMYGTRNPVTKFANIMKAVNAIITEKLEEYAEERRDARLTLRRQWKWNSEKFEFINEELERLGLT
ncbi:hypothetical protein C8J56DRAFT_904802 [Mycena floridula]|nr:hypothetical protein C8J56DRAFT_904802 [Mycena floridula]